ncbi:hypothetical protein JTB14_029820 [Gonioctena quinquepunctata]|nr:hypothetical protein JTB14_029820 [Gonioctena quinquepunctata]
MAKQHEAMRRAISLAERNKQLESEIKDIDQIALAVEAECNDTVKSNVDRFSRLQDQMNESVISIQNLERENAKLITEKKQLSAELDAVTLEKRNLQKLLEKEVEDKKRLTDKINNFTVIEHDLNMEIDRLLRMSGEQKRKIAELECQVQSSAVEYSKFPGMQKDPPSITATDKLIKKTYKPASKPTTVESGSKTKQTPATKPKKACTCKKTGAPKHSSNLKQTSVHGEVEEDRRPSSTTDKDRHKGKCCCDAEGCVKTMKELLDKEMDYRQEQATKQIESLRQEKDYYMKEYQKIVEQMKGSSGPDKHNKLQYQFDELLSRVKEKDMTITTLQSEMKMLSNEKSTLSARLESLRRDSSETDLLGVCQKTNCKRKARELEVHRGEVKHLEKENDSLKSKIQTLNASTVFDQERMKKAFQDMEEHIRKLENERRDLVVGQVTTRSNVSQLEEELNMAKDQLRSTQSELNTHKANYSQLKILHDQSDRALSEAQSQLLRAETELQGYKSKMNLTHRESAGYEREIAMLQNDVDVMKTNLSKLDKEKDELLNIVDEKTEKIDHLENQLREKKKTLSNMEEELKELKRKLRPKNKVHVAGTLDKFDLLTNCRIESTRTISGLRNIHGQTALLQTSSNSGFHGSLHHLVNPVDSAGPPLLTWFIRGLTFV